MLKTYTQKLNTKITTKKTSFFLENVGPLLAMSFAVGVSAGYVLTTYVRKRRGPGTQRVPYYFDYNATTPIDPAVAEAMQVVVESKFGNPSSGHVYGREAKTALTNARRWLSKLLNARVNGDRVIFMSCATESINSAIKGTVLRILYPAKGAAESKANDDTPMSHTPIHIVTSAVEHVAVLETVKYLVQTYPNVTATILPVNSKGAVEKDDLKNALTPDTRLVTLMLANNETGTLNDIEGLCRIVKMYNENIIFHTDASQAVGKIIVDVQALGIDLLTVAGHKFYAPKGIGALYLRDGVTVAPLLHGASSQEMGMRTGTENVVLSAGLGKAAELMLVQGVNVRAHMASMRDLLSYKIASLVHQKSPQVVISVNGDVANRLPNTLSIAFHDVSATEILEKISDKVVASTSAACHSDVVSMSHVLKAMATPPQVAMGTMRLSVGRWTNQVEVEACANAIAEAVCQIVSEI